VQQDTHGHRGRIGDPLYGIRRVLRRGADTLTDRAWDRLLAALDTGDAGGQVAAAWIAAQDLRLLYRAPDRSRAAHLLHELRVHCADSGLPKLARLARTLDAWRPRSSPPSTTEASPTDPPKPSLSGALRGA